MLHARKITLLLAALLLCFCGTASARVLAIYQGGQVIPASVLTTASCSNPGDPSNGPQLVALFSEQVNGTAPPVTTTLQEDAGESTEVDLQVSIVEACAAGQVAFKYRHDSDTASADINISPREFGITLDLVTGASASQSVSYAVIDDDEAEGDEAVDLVGYQVTFFVGGATGTTSGHRVMAHILIPANSETVVDDNDIPDDVSLDQMDVIETLNTACSKAADGSDLDETCGVINRALDDDDPVLRKRRTIQLADELDPEIVTVSPASQVAIGRTQFSNLQSRLQALHRNAGTVSEDSNIDLGLRMNGNSWAGANWIGNYLNAAGAQDGGGSRLLSDKWGYFLNGSFNFGDKNAAMDVPTFDFSFYGVTGGLDYRFDGGVVVGAAFGYTRFDADLANNAGEAVSDAYSLMGFGTFDIVDNLYVDATLGYSTTEFQQTRVVDLSEFAVPMQTLIGRTDVKQLSASFSLNYRAYLGKGWTMTPYASIYYANTEADPFAEHGGSLALSYQTYSFNSLISTLGLRTSTVINTRHGVISPFVDLDYQHEGRQGAFEIKTAYLAVESVGPTVSIGDPERNFGTLGAGASWVFASGDQLFVRASSQLANRTKTLYSITIGGHFEF